ncbi:hypothetical protein Q9K01_02260 [Qipengyuania sp. DY56-A-20]|uniref:Uncharacterized protein n=1 Tax=Qipengyuania benthica TaxID=3067651 RepID=A0ABT9H580_9SPHN|nr:hypothetical protein [Qipengyuania sp. DY56-A-20]MDP4538451.1 hypothetical protein [Qipengyuania sp. DY56-A-20]
MDKISHRETAILRIEAGSQDRGARFEAAPGHGFSAGMNPKMAAREMIQQSCEKRRIGDIGQAKPVDATFA